MNASFYLHEKWNSVRENIDNQGWETELTLGILAAISHPEN